MKRNFCWIRYGWAILLCLLVSCRVQIPAKLLKEREQNIAFGKKIYRKSNVKLDSFRQIEAKLVDVPVPITAIPIVNFSSFKADNTDTTIVLGYDDIILSSKDLQEFYHAEMERLGWCQKESYQGYESVLRFIKGDRSCFIIIRPYSKGIQFVIATGTRAIVHSTI